MNTIYEHRQPGLAIVLLLVVPIFGFLLALLLAAETAPLPRLFLLLGFMLLTAHAFSSLTVKVDPEKVVLSFGFGFPRRSFSMKQIRSVRVVRNSPWMGLGIHFIRDGMIYNVSGLDGVEIKLTDGHLARVGSDQPAALAQAIADAMNQANP